MRFEHFALNVPDPIAMAHWYAKHCGFTVAVANKEGTMTHFLADSTGRVVFEIYYNPKGAVADFAAQHPLTFHFALVADDAEKERQRLIEAGATYVEEVRPNEDSLLIMMRDPWGVPLQLCQRVPAFP